MDGPNAKVSSIDSENQHINIQFSDTNGKFYCCIYFAEQFQQFRSLMIKDGGKSNRNSVRQVYSYSKMNTYSEDLYIYSLASCIPWNALGGKSGSTFSKTQNQRFILKEVSKGELKHFLSFVTDYIDYCKKPYNDKSPSSLVKVVGVYKISYKDTNTNKGSIHYILVMENLFYECNISFIYDLKGSMRNRKVDINLNLNKVAIPDATENNDTKTNDDATGQQELSSTSTVLLDENLRQISTIYPLYVHEHSKKHLMAAIDRDSEFLRIHGVMDYSLLVGFDEEHMEYVVGIIDYVRLFNWEKIIEFRVKKIGNTIDPTIVNPLSYQRRFIDAINDYFIEVPDKWHPFMDYTPLVDSNENPVGGKRMIDQLANGIDIINKSNN